MSTELTTNKEFETWLDENYWFEDAYCLNFIANEELNNISLTLAYQIKGTYEAGSERIRRVFELVAENPRDLPDITKIIFNPEHCMEGIELVETPEGIKFSLDIPRKLDIFCKKLSISQKQDLVDTVKPWVSETELFVHVVEGAAIPKPETWVSWFKGDGVDLSWRYYGGDPRESSAIPERNYEGWYLQELSAIPTTSEGLFFQHLKKQGDNLGFHVRRTEFSDRCWRLFEKYLLNIESTKISCGNCKFTRREWEKYLIEA